MCQGSTKFCFSVMQLALENSKVAYSVMCKMGFILKVIGTHFYVYAILNSQPDTRIMFNLQRGFLSTFSAHLPLGILNYTFESKLEEKKDHALTFTLAAMAKLELTSLHLNAKSYRERKKGFIFSIQDLL